MAHRIKMMRIIKNEDEDNEDSSKQINKLH